MPSVRAGAYKKSDNTPIYYTGARLLLVCCAFAVWHDVQYGVALPIDSVQAESTLSPSLPHTGYAQNTWDSAPACQATPTAGNSNRDASGRLWGWEQQQNCELLAVAACLSAFRLFACILNR